MKNYKIWRVLSIITKVLFLICIGVCFWCSLYAHTAEINSQLLDNLVIVKIVSIAVSWVDFSVCLNRDEIKSKEKLPDQNGTVIMTKAKIGGYLNSNRIKSFSLIFSLIMDLDIIAGYYFCFDILFGGNTTFAVAASTFIAAIALIVSFIGFVADNEKTKYLLSGIGILLTGVCCICGGIYYLVDDFVLQIVSAIGILAVVISICVYMTFVINKKISNGDFKDKKRRGTYKVAAAIGAVATIVMLKNVKIDIDKKLLGAVMILIALLSSYGITHIVRWHYYKVYESKD